MPRFPLVPVLTFAVVSSVQAQNAAPKPLSASQRQLVSRLTNEWKAYFRGISSLEMQWQTSGDSYFGDGTRDTTRYSYSGASDRQRLDIALFSDKTLPQNLKTATHLEASGYVKEFDVFGSGSSRATARPITPETKNQLGAVIPLLEVFGWAPTADLDFNLATFRSDAMWQHFASRVETVEAAKWQGKGGWWLSFPQQKTPQSQQSARVFIDRVSLFPTYVTGTIAFKTKEVNREITFRTQVKKVQRIRVKSQIYWMPLEYSSRSETNDLATKKRTVQVRTTTLLAPPKINSPIAPQRWQLVIPNKTLVYYAPSLKTKISDETPFQYDAKGGSLWAQNQHEHERHANSLRRFRALPAIYDEKADGEAQIAAALKQAAAQNKNVLLQFGAYWCSPCHTMHDLLLHDATVAPLVKANYILVPIDLNNHHNEATFNRLKSAEQGGIPFLIVLDAQGKRLAAPPTLYFDPKKGDKPFDLPKLAGFLEHWKPQS